MNNSEGPDEDPFRPDQKTPLKNFFLAGSYTKQVILNSSRTVAFLLPKFLGTLTRLFQQKQEHVSTSTL